MTDDFSLSLKLARLLGGAGLAPTRAQKLHASRYYLSMRKTQWVGIIAMVQASGRMHASFTLARMFAHAQRQPHLPRGRRGYVRELAEPPLQNLLLVFCTSST